MRLPIAFFLLLLSLGSNAQTNIYSLLNVPETFNSTPGVHDYKGNLYLMSYHETDSVFWPKYPWLKPMQYSLHKYNGQTHTLMASTVVCGDTDQADSVVLHSPKLEVEGDRVHLAYVKRIVHDTFSLPMHKQHWWALYYKQLDTNLNVVVPEKLLKLVDYSEKLAGLHLKHMNVSDKITLSFYQTDSAIFSSKVSKYIQLNMAGNKLKEDSLGLLDMPSQNPNHEVAEIINYPGNRYLISGSDLYNFPGSFRMFYLADSLMNMIDTFAIKPSSVFNAPDVQGFFTSIPELVALPTGSLIGGTNYVHQPANATHTGIIKCTPGNRFAINKLATFKNIDPTDLSHTIGVSFHNLVYNSNDNSIYYANVTHKMFGSNCINNENFIEVLCLDTNLVVKWKKYIRVAPDMCADIGYLEACPNGPGVVVSGFSANTNDPQNKLLHINFIYRLDSAIVANVSEKQKTDIRDRVTVYPNPANEYVQIDDVFKGNCTALLYNMRGQLMTRKEITGPSTRLATGSYPDGLYYLKITTEDGEVFSFKIVKE